MKDIKEEMINEITENVLKNFTPEQIAYLQKTCTVEELTEECNEALDSVAWLLDLLL